MLSSRALVQTEMQVASSSIKLDLILCPASKLNEIFGFFFGGGVKT